MKQHGMRTICICYCMLAIHLGKYILAIDEHCSVYYQVSNATSNVYIHD